MTNREKLKAMGSEELASTLNKDCFSTCVKYRYNDCLFFKTDEQDQCIKSTEEWLESEVEADD